MNPWAIFWGTAAALFVIFLLLPYQRSAATREALLGAVSGVDTKGNRVISIHRVGLALGILMLAWTDIKITNAVVRYIDRTTADPFAYFAAALGGMSSLAGITYLGKNLIQAKAGGKDPKEGGASPEAPQ